MIPDLPEPFRYLSWASVLGYVGFTITDTNYQMSKDGKGDTASLVHGTALSTTSEAYRTFSIKMILNLTKRLLRLTLTIKRSCMRTVRDIY